MRKQRHREGIHLPTVTQPVGGWARRTLALDPLLPRGRCKRGLPWSWHVWFSAHRVKKLKETLVAVQQLDKNMSSLRTWLAHIESELAKPIVYDSCNSEEIQRKLNEQQVKYRTMARRWIGSWISVLLTRLERWVWDGKSEGSSAGLVRKGRRWLDSCQGHISRSPQSFLRGRSTLIGLMSLVLQEAIKDGSFGWATMMYPTQGWQFCLCICESLTCNHQHRKEPFFPLCIVFWKRFQCILQVVRV